LFKIGAYMLDEDIEDEIKAIAIISVGLSVVGSNEP
jgi:hypothetical protein